MEGDSVKHKKKALAMLLALVLLIAAVGGTLALFTREARATNVITTGTVDITLTETGSGTPILDDNGNQTGLAFTNIMPGTAVTKTPNIENTGTADAYVRAIVAVTIKAADGVTELSTVLRSGAPVVTFNIDGGKWVTKAGEQYYYYNKVLTPGESVDLFNQVTFDPAMGNEYQGCTVTVSIQAQAVQAKNNEIPVGGSILDVNGWPGEVPPTPTPEVTPEPTPSPEE